MALDTSHLGQLVKEMTSRRADERRRAKDFQDLLDRGGWVLAFSHHHLAEIYGHNDPQVRDARLAYIRSLPIVAYVQSVSGPEAAFGSIVDVLATEVRAAISIGNSDPVAVAAAALPYVFAYASGAAVMRSLDAVGPIFGSLVRAQANKARRIVALSRADVEKPPDLPIDQLLRQPLRTPESQEAFFASFGAVLLREVAERGDERIEDPAEVTAEFISAVQDGVREIHETGEHPVIHLLNRMGIRREDIADEGTLGDALRIFLHRQRALTAASAAGINPRDVIEHVRTDKLPSAVIGEALQAYGQEPKRRKGSVMNDVNLVCLTPYVHLTTVDKGTFGNVARASARSPSFKSVIGRVTRQASYYELTPEITKTGQDITAV
ncbi:hypothetical protein BK022_14680 [Methylorubrum extorquens]|uniref:Uncharacterized protein n=1 Tax=Methylorubrum extorquens TaxID=408 RepID=A0A1S1P632_METEX|nr:hypothetical protein BK022_14680 [Methylorubrum extorquens]